MGREEGVRDAPTAGLQTDREGTDTVAVERVYPERVPARDPRGSAPTAGLEAPREGRGPVCKRGLQAVIFASALLLLATPALAGSVYKWTDTRGVVHFTNVSPDARYSPVQLFPPGRTRSRQPIGRMKTYDALIERFANRQGIPPALVKAVIHAESAFDPYAVSPKGAMGLMQLLPSTARALGVTEPFGVNQNISGGARYLRMMYERFGSWSHALAAYNAGPQAVARYRGIPPYRETQEYVRRVLNYYRRYDVEFRR